jgi:hypothetical protein
MSWPPGVALVVLVLVLVLVLSQDVQRRNRRCHEAES